MARDPHEQLVHFISDMYSVEQQALAQLVSAPALAGDPAIAEDFRLHNVETKRQAQLVQQRLEAHGGSASVIKNAIMKLGGKGFLAFAAALPETPGRLIAHAYSYEAMEWAGYEMLIRFAEHAGDAETVEAAREIRDQERVMMERLERGFTAAEAVSHRDTPPEDMGAHLRKHLEEAHALESQGIHLMTKSTDIADDPDLARACEENLEDARKHARLLEQRLEALGASPSSFKDAALGSMAWNWAYFFQAQTDTPAKLAAFAYAFEHLKIAGYELLLRSARRAGDTESASLCELILTEEREMAERLSTTFDSAVEATLEAVEA